MEEGKNLWDAVNLTVQAATEVDALETELSKGIGDELKSVGVKLGFNSDPGSPEVDDVAADWVRVATLLQWGLKHKGKKTNYTGNIYVQVVLWDEDDENSPCGQIPRIEVGYCGYDSEEKIDADYWGAGASFTRETWEEFFPKTKGKYACWPKSVKPCKGVRWDDGANWVFAVPLFSVNSSNDIDSLIIQPAMKLLSGESPEEAFNDVQVIIYAIGKDGHLLSTPA